MTRSAGDKNGYEVNPTNAYTSDGALAVDNNSGTNSSTNCTNNGKDKHHFYNYTISLPNGATVKGIDVRWDAKVNATSGSPQICVQLSWNGGMTWTNAKSTTRLTTSEATYILGSATDNWGHAWMVMFFKGL